MVGSIQVPDRPGQVHATQHLKPASPAFWDDAKPHTVFRWMEAGGSQLQQHLHAEALHMQMLLSKGLAERQRLVYDEAQEHLHQEDQVHCSGKFDKYSAAHCVSQPSGRGGGGGLSGTFIGGL